MIEPSSSEPRKLWLRVLLMLLLGAAFQLAASVLFFVALLQLLLAVVSNAPNARLRHFGRDLGPLPGPNSRLRVLWHRGAALSL
jgi:hypothetical protein